MTTDKKKAAIREACIAANPEKFQCPIGEDPIWWEGSMPKPRLEDILLAIQDANKYMSSYEIPLRAIVKLTLPRYENGVYQGESHYNLRKPFDDQSPECIDFLYDLLASGEKV